MRAILFLLKTIVVFAFIGMATVFIFAALLIGGLFSLLSGRKPQFKVYTNRNFGEGLFTSPGPMKDVTPKAVTQLE